MTIYELTEKEKEDLRTLNEKFNPYEVIGTDTCFQYDYKIWASLCNKYTGDYQIINTHTVEFMRYLMNYFFDGPYLEICAGHGTLGKELGIQSIDSQVMNRPEVAPIYDIPGLKRLNYPSYVENITVDKALKKYCPETIVGCWVTQLYDKVHAPKQCSVFGVDELKMLETKGVKNYIHFGNELTHNKKRIRSRAKYIFKAPWLYTRSCYPKGNEILVFTEKDIDHIPSIFQIESKKPSGC